MDEILQTDEDLKSLKIIKSENSADSLVIKSSKNQMVQMNIDMLDEED